MRYDFERKISFAIPLDNDRYLISYKTAVAIAEVIDIYRILAFDDYATFIDYPYNALLQELRKKLNLNQGELSDEIEVAPNTVSTLKKQLKRHTNMSIIELYH